MLVNSSGKNSPERAVANLASAKTLVPETLHSKEATLSTLKKLESVKQFTALKHYTSEASILAGESRNLASLLKAQGLGTTISPKRDVQNKTEIKSNKYFGS